MLSTAHNVTISTPEPRMIAEDVPLVSQFLAVCAMNPHKVSLISFFELFLISIQAEFERMITPT